MDFLKRLVNSQEQKCEPLDPYLVGRIAGSRAFATGDWVVLLKCDNVPAKVRRDPSDFPGAVRVILGNQSDAVYGETCYFASDLGYPLSKNLWSENQLNWYQKCHKEEHFINLAKSFLTRQESKRPNKRFDIWVHIEKHHYALWSVFSSLGAFASVVGFWALLFYPQVVMPYVILIALSILILLAVIIVNSKI